MHVSQHFAKLRADEVYEGSGADVEPVDQRAGVQREDAHVVACKQTRYQPETLGNPFLRPTSPIRIKRSVARHAAQVRVFITGL